MMPESRYDERAHDWVSFSQGERAAMSAAYNLRVGLIIAALCFGASERVDQVCVRIDSIGLEEAVAEQDSAISDLMSAALRSFERLHTGDAGASKADPKDGDHHGDPSHTPSAEPAPDARTPQADARGAQDAKTDSAGESVSATVGDDDLQSLESFADMMKDINFEDFVRDSPQEVQDSDSGDTGQADDAGAAPGGEGNEEGDTDPHGCAAPQPHRAKPRHRNVHQAGVAAAAARRRVAAPRRHLSPVRRGDGHRRAGRTRPHQRRIRPA